MRILQICNKVPFPPKDGGSIAMYNIARGLAAEGHSVDILAMETPKHPVQDTSKELPENVTMKTYFVDTSIKPFQLLKSIFFSSIPYIAKRFIDKGFEDELIKQLANNKYDIVQLEGLYLMPYIPAIRNHAKSKIALRSHNIESEIWKRLFRNEKSIIKKLYLKQLSNKIRKFEARAINKYDFLIPITYRDAAEYQKLGNSKPGKVIQTGIPRAEIAEKLVVREKRKLYFLGSLDWLPNQEGLIWFVENVWPMISHSSANLEFHVAGRNAPDWFPKLIDKPGITFHGEIEDALAFVDKYDIMIVPLLSGGGMRVKIVEAMAKGKIIVTTPIGAEGLDIIPNYHAIVAETPSDIAAGVQVILDNTDFLIKLGENSIRFIKNNYTNRALAKELANFYESNL